MSIKDLESTIRDLIYFNGKTAVVEAITAELGVVEVESVVSNYANEKTNTQAAKEFTASLVILVEMFPPEGFDREFFINCSISHHYEEATEYINKYIPKRLVEMLEDKTFIVPMPSDEDLPADKREYVRIPYGVSFLTYGHFRGIHAPAQWERVVAVKTPKYNNLKLVTTDGHERPKNPSCDLMYGAYNIIIGEGNIPPIGEKRDPFTQITRYVK